VTGDGQVKVLDFGLAKFEAGEAGRAGEAGGLTHSPTLSVATTQAGVILGTAAYMSPEQAKGRAADKRSDVWAFGCVLYEMLAGKRAFDGEDISDQTRWRQFSAQSRIGRSSRPMYGRTSARWSSAASRRIAKRAFRIFRSCGS
jgi:serine/threonine protein kinase